MFSNKIGKGPSNHRLSAEERRILDAHFDTGFYLAENPDVREVGADPLTHFIDLGWREGRNPCREFDTCYYLLSNPDVAAAGINPFLHFLCAGADEGRKTHRPLNDSRRQLEASLPLRVKALTWIIDLDRSEMISAARLADAIDSRNAGGWIISFSHDDYASKYGGVQKVIANEQASFSRTQWHYLHVSPAGPLPMLADSMSAKDFFISLRADGELIGIANLADLKTVVLQQHAKGIDMQCIIHHLMGFATELVLDLVQASGDRRPIVWIHDFFTICPSYTLMRNDVEFCGGPQPDSAGCTICSYGGDRSSHLTRMRAFFQATQPSVLAPSAVALDLWHRLGGFAYSESELRPIARLIAAQSMLGNFTDNPSDRPLRVAHLGARIFSKGWCVFERLALRFAQSGHYKFFQLGVPDVGPVLPSVIRNIPVIVNQARPDAMIEAIAEASIDIVVSWQLWPETFSLTVHEALAGGAFVVTSVDAGNVWPAVVANAPTQGCVMANEVELLDLFESKRLQSLFHTLPRLRGTLRPVNITANWLGARKNHPSTAQNPSGSTVASRLGYDEKPRDD